MKASTGAPRSRWRLACGCGRSWRRRGGGVVPRRRAPLAAGGGGAGSRFSIGLVVVAGMSIGTLFTLFVLPMVYVSIATDHRAAADSERAKEIAEFDLGSKALRST